VVIGGVVVIEVVVGGCVLVIVEVIVWVLVTSMVLVMVVVSVVVSVVSSWVHEGIRTFTIISVTSIKDSIVFFFKLTTFSSGKQ
jgi:hypothetical protein